MNVNELTTKNLIVTHKAGSHAYGTNTPTSDEDIRGIFVADPECIRTPFFPVKEVADNTAEDTKYFELNHFMRLATLCNPSVVESLWVEQSDVLLSTPAYELLRKHRSDLLSKKIFFTTTGYAHSQLGRILGHNKWLAQQQAGVEALKKKYQAGACKDEWLRENFDEEFLTFMNNCEVKTIGWLGWNQDAYFKDLNINLISNKRPRQVDFVSLVFNFTNDKMFKLDLEAFKTDHRLIPYSGDTYGLYKMKGYQPFDALYNLNTKYEKDESQFLGQPLAIVKFNVGEYKTALEKYNNFWSWRKNRNVARHDLEAKHGFDTKHGMHLIRLMKIAHEALTTGEILIKRPDAQELLDIRNGSLTYDEILKYADDLEQKAKHAYENCNVLRHSPDLKLAARITMEVQDLVWK